MTYDIKEEKESCSVRHVSKPRVSESVTSMKQNYTHAHKGAQEKRKAWKEEDLLIPVQKVEVSIDKLLLYAQVSGDYNAIHTDEKVAQAHGLPSVIVHGMMLMSFMGDVLRFNFSDDAYKVEQLTTRFKKIVLANDRITSCGKITQKKSIDGKDVFYVDLWVENQNKEIVAQGNSSIREL